MVFLWFSYGFPMVFHIKWTQHHHFFSLHSILQNQIATSASRVHLAELQVRHQTSILPVIPSDIYMYVQYISTYHISTQRYVCRDTYVYVYIYIYVDTFMYIYISVYRYKGIHIDIQMYRHKDAYRYTQIYRYWRYLHLCVNIHIYIYISIYVSIYIYPYIDI